ncbi:glycosyltransferase family 2 protein [Bradyrhizobium sp. RDM4]|uniref:glycosyltransferase family 2 protein n=1 Tax=Bradyrhizobium sp. RDM4 TaxID=3378765 RepID=UPI0038FC2340
MSSASLVMAYYENPGMLRAQFAAIRALPAQLRDLLHVVIVDDGSPDHPAQPEEIGCPLQIWRIGVDVRWNQDAARNIGVHHAETDWVLLTDMDHIVPEATWLQLLLRSYDGGVAYRFRRVSAPDMASYKPHPNSWFLARKLFDRAGGYDENFAGIYGTDALFRDALRATAREIVMLKEVLIRYPREVVADASTTRYLRKQPEDRAGMAEMGARRAADPHWQPKRLSFPYSRVA